jgi:Ser/Thr protein kinase RdoA (MazF antagonist)
MDSDLSAVLARYPAVARPSAEPEALGNSGGLSGSRLWRYGSGSGLLVARAWPVDSPPRPVLEEVHGWLADAGRLVIVPVPIPGLDGRSLQEHAGHLWELSPWMRGAADPSRPPSTARVRAGFTALAAFHQRLAHHTSLGPSAGLLARWRELEWLLAGGFTTIEQVVALESSDPLGDLARQWIEAARPAARDVHIRLKRAAGMPIRRQPCLRDVRPEHFLFAGDEVTGLVDFGAMGIDTVAADLARLLSEWFGRDLPLRQAALESYTSLRPIESAETLLIDVFEGSSAILGPGHWVRWHFLEGRRFQEPNAVIRGLEKGLERLETWVRNRKRIS